MQVLHCHCSAWWADPLPAGLASATACIYQEQNQTNASCCRDQSSDDCQELIRAAMIARRWSGAAMIARSWSRAAMIARSWSRAAMIARSWSGAAMIARSWSDKRWLPWVDPSSDDHQVLTRTLMIARVGHHFFVNPGVDRWASLKKVFILCQINLCEYIKNKTLCTKQLGKNALLFAIFV